MKNLIYIFLLISYNLFSQCGCVCIISGGTNEDIVNANGDVYYVSNTGDDNNSGLSSTTPWKTITKVNSEMASMSPGDKIAFKKGQTFTGKLIIGRSGDASHDLEIVSYSSGNAPIISGLQTLTNWTSMAGGSYKTSLSTMDNLNTVVLNGSLKAKGRYPNTTYLKYEATTGEGRITDFQLPNSPNWVGAQISARKQRWISDHTTVLTHTDSVVTYTTVSSSEPDAGNGYFFQNDIRTLDALGEWFYKPSVDSLFMHFGGSSPSFHTIKASVYDTLLQITNRSYITIDGINFQGGNYANISIYGGKNITIKNCTIDLCGRTGIVGGPDYAMTEFSNIYNNTIKNCLNNGIHGNFGNTTIYNNTFRNIAMLDGMGDNSSGTYTAIQLNGHRNYVRYNDIDSVGYNGVFFLAYNGDSIYIDYNKIQNFCAVKDDGGAIYTHSADNDYRWIRDNIIMNGISNMAAVKSGETNATYGIYLDEGSANVKVLGNTVANGMRGGIFDHGGTENTIDSNICYNNFRQLMFTPASSNVSADTFRLNTLYSKKSDQHGFYFAKTTSGLGTYGKSDYNAYHRPILIEPIVNTMRYDDGFTDRYWTLSQWRTQSSNDAHSTTAQLVILDTNDIVFDYNFSGVDKIISFTGTYRDKDSTAYTGSYTIPPYKSIVLTKDNGYSSVLFGISNYWSFNETSGTGLNNNIGTNDATAVNATANSGGKLSYCRAFDGTGDYVTFTDDDITTGKEEQTINLWVYPTDTNDTRTIWSRQYYTYFQNTITTQFWYTRDASTTYNGARNNDLTMPSLPLNTWTMLTFRYSKSEGKKSIYKNGTLFSQSTTSVDALTTENETETLGHCGSGDLTDFNGRIDEIGIFDKALSSTEITTLYNSGSGKAFPFN